VANVSTDKAFLGLSGGDMQVIGVGASVLAAYKMVVEGVFNLVRSFVKEIVGAMGESSLFFILTVEEVALLQGEVSAFGKGNVLLETRHALPHKDHIVHRAGAEGVGTSANRGLSDGAFKRVHDLNEKTGGVLISGYCPFHVTLRSRDFCHFHFCIFSTSYISFNSSSIA
jgi:hypothetical protein